MTIQAAVKLALDTGLCRACDNTRPLYLCCGRCRDCGHSLDCAKRDEATAYYRSLDRPPKRTRA